MIQQKRQIKIRTVNAFTDNGKGGNPAGVVLDADHLGAAQKLSIAKQIGLSETAFVSSSTLAAFKLDFFTPLKQIPHCGHATIAAFSVLAQLGFVGSSSSKETIDGRREIYLTGEEAYMEQLAPKYSGVEGYQQQVLSSLGLCPEDLLVGAPMLKVNTGNSFIIVPVASAQVLAGLKLDFEAIALLSEIFDLIGIYVVTLETSVAGRNAGTRMFAPRFGILEESATGMAAGPLGCYLYDILGVRKAQLLIEQGNFMVPRAPSLLKVELNLADGKITGLLVGGTASVGEVSLLDVEVPDGFNGLFVL